MSIDGLTFAVPAGWELLDVSEDSVYLRDPAGDLVWAVIDKYKPGVDPVGLANSAVEVWVLGAEGYSDVQSGDAKLVEGTESVAVVNYRAVWTETQGSAELAGIIFVAVKRDGTALFVQVEAFPPSALKANGDTWNQLVDPMFNAFLSS